MAKKIWCVADFIDGTELGTRLTLEDRLFYEVEGRRNRWPSAEDEPQRWSAVVCYAAAMRTGVLPAGTSWNQFRSLVVDAMVTSEDPNETADPTPLGDEAAGASPDPTVTGTFTAPAAGTVSL